MVLERNRLIVNGTAISCFVSIDLLYLLAVATPTQL